MDVLMPQLGETVDEGKILVWYKKVGDKIEPGDNLFEIETEKVSMEVPSTVAGTLSEIKVAVDETAPVGAVVAVITEPGAQAAASAPQAKSEQARQRKLRQHRRPRPVQRAAAAAPQPAADDVVRRAQAWSLSKKYSRRSATTVLRASTESRRLRTRGDLPRRRE